MCMVDINMRKVRHGTIRTFGLVIACFLGVRGSFWVEKSEESLSTPTTHFVVKTIAGLYRFISCEERELVLAW